MFVLTFSPKSIIRSGDDDNVQQNVVAHFDTCPQIWSSVIDGHAQGAEPLTTPGNTRENRHRMSVRLASRQRAVIEQAAVSEWGESDCVWGPRA